MQEKRHSAFPAALIGGLSAVFIAYGLSAAGVIGCFANVTAPAAICPGWAGLLRAAVNLYVMQHVFVSGSMVADSVKYSDSVSLPLTIWVIIPILAIVIGGYCAGIRRRSAGASAAILAGTGAGVVYAIVLTALSSLFKTTIDHSALPSLQGFSFNPNEKMLMGPTILSAAVHTGLFGICFGFSGGMLASGRLSALSQPNKWWACAKPVIVIGTVAHFILMLVYGYWVFWGIQTEQLQDTPRWQVFTLSPAITSLVFSAISGETISGSLTSSTESSSGFGGTANIYRGTSDAAEPGGVRPFPLSIAAIAAAGSILASFLMGGLAVRWGSRDGSIHTAARIVIIATVCLLITNLLSGFGWNSAVGDIQMKLAIKPQFARETFFIFAGIFLFSLTGAHSIRIWYVKRRGFPS